MADKNSIVYFPVANGDMILIQEGQKGIGKTILVDMNVRSASSIGNDWLDAENELYDHLPKNGNGIPYVDLFILTHPDQDHCRGFEKLFHSGDVSDWQEPSEGEPLRIIANEIWFSELCTRRYSKNLTLCEDAKSVRTEAKRRRELFVNSRSESAKDGNRLKVIGISDDGRKENWDLDGLVIDRGEKIVVGSATAHILGPFDDSIFDGANEKDKNSSSIIAMWEINGSKVLLGGDATVHIWKHVGLEYDSDDLKYDILLAPHHCSWRSLSYDSASDCDDPKVDDDAFDALSNYDEGAFIVSSSNKISSKDSDPPSELAKSKYTGLVSAQNFKCLGDSPKKILAFSLAITGVSIIGPSGNSSSTIPNEKKPIRHG